MNNVKISKIICVWRWRWFVLLYTCMFSQTKSFMLHLLCPLQNWCYYRTRGLWFYYFYLLTEWRLLCPCFLRSILSRSTIQCCWVVTYKTITENVWCVDYVHKTNNCTWCLKTDRKIIFLFNVCCKIKLGSVVVPKN